MPVQGGAALLGPPLAGALVEATHHTAASLQATAALLLAATSIFVLASLHNRQVHSTFSGVTCLLLIFLIFFVVAFNIFTFSFKREKRLGYEQL